MFLWGADACPSGKKDGSAAFFTLVYDGHGIGAVSYTHLDVYKRQYLDVVDDDEELYEVSDMFARRLEELYDIDLNGGQ